MTAYTPWGLLDAAGSHLRQVLLWGPPGTGKTYLAQRCGTRPGLPVYRVICTEDTPAAELRGHWIPRGAEFVWHDGPAMLAYRNGGRLVVDEITRATDDALSFMLAVLDGHPITLPTGETVHPHRDMSVWATSNDGPERLTDALADRLTVRVHCDVVNPDALAMLRPELARGVTTADDAGGVSYREAQEYQRLTDEGITDTVAARLVWGDRADDVIIAIGLAATRPATRRPAHV